MEQPAKAEGRESGMKYFEHPSPTTPTLSFLPQVLRLHYCHLAFQYQGVSVCIP